MVNNILSEFSAVKGFYELVSSTWSLNFPSYGALRIFLRSIVRPRCRLIDIGVNRFGCFGNTVSKETLYTYTNDGFDVIKTGKWNSGEAVVIGNGKRCQLQ